MSNRLVMIQPAPGPDLSRPLPIYVDEHGSVQQQDFWKGDPLTVVGFADRFDGGLVTLRFADFWLDPTRAVGKYAVLIDDAENVSAHVSAVHCAEVVVDDDGNSAGNNVGRRGED